MRPRELAASAHARFVAAGIGDGEARLDAELLLRHVLGWDRATWLTRRDDAALSDPAAAAFELLVRRREAREPVAYLRGEQEFYGRPFAVAPGVLIPRPETELLVEVGLAAIRGRRQPRLLDLGTGSGCLAVTLALERDDGRVVASDISADALAQARANAARHGVEPRIAFRLGHGPAGDAGPFDLVVANPPYVRDGDTLAPEVGVYEPTAAVFGGPDGLDVVRALAPDIAAVLAPGGLAAIEIGVGQAEAAAAVLGAAGLAVREVRLDLQRIPRVVVVVKP
jgi:release factor glutamine methyltransferase